MDEDNHFYRRRLPHLRCEHATYFVTWRLAAHQQSLSVIERDGVVEAIRHFNEHRYVLLAYVVMDDHAHVLVKPNRGQALEWLLHSWKSYSAHSIRRPAGRGQLWQREYFDRVVRDERELNAFVQYIVQNPSTRWPGVTGYPWVWCRKDLLE